MKPEILDQQGSTLGGQLRRRRLGLRLRQNDAARLLGVDPNSLMRWERDEREPADRFFPAIITFLGFEPWPVSQTLAEALRAERRRRGLAIASAAALVGVDEGTWQRWEHGEWKPTSLTRPFLDKFLRVNCAILFPSDVR
jgi:transcriptional regulator with XRE-family HTH domain